jgi:serine/threonine protein kinase
MKERQLGPYRLLRRIATGGMAEVYEARRTGPSGWQRRVAVKCILPQHATDEDFVQMFGDEARLAARLEHPSIVGVHDFGEIDGTLYIAMELVDGTNVGRLIRAAAAAGEVVPLAALLEIGAESAAALAYAHDLHDEDDRPLSIVHRDVSPANLLLTRRGEVKLADFGIARFSEAAHRTDEGHVRGKLGYMSPEQVTGQKVDGRSDVFTLATVLAEMRIGEPLFGSGTDLEILVRIRNADLALLMAADPARMPSDLREVLVHALSRKPADRPDARAFAFALTALSNRRRLFGRGREELARLLERLELAPIDPDSLPARDPVARPTGVVDTNGKHRREPGSNELLAKLSSEEHTKYEIAGQNGAIAGPYSFADIVRKIIGGEIKQGFEVRREGEQGLGAPELDRYLRSPARRWEESELAQATMGAIEPGTVLALVNRIVGKRRTGMLRLDEERPDGSAKRKKIYFVDGKPEFASSTMREELLGEYLVRNGTCMRMEVDMALAVLPRHGGRLGDALVNLGVLRPAQLFTAVRGQVRERYLEGLRWESGRWAFVPNARSEEEAYPIELGGLELVRDGVLYTGLPTIHTALGSLGQSVLVPADRPILPLGAYAVPDAWERTFAAVRGPRSVERWRDAAVRTAKVPPDDASRAIFFGLVSELVRAA